MPDTEAPWATLETGAAPRIAVKVDTAAQMLDVGRQKIYELMAAGALPSFRIGGSRRIAVEDVQSYVRSLRTSPVPAEAQPHLTCPT